MIWVSAQEVIAFHDRILQRFPGVAGLTDPGRAQALIYRVQNRVHYEGVTDLFELAATYWVAFKFKEDLGHPVQRGPRTSRSPPE